MFWKVLGPRTASFIWVRVGVRHLVRMDVVRNDAPDVEVLVIRLMLSKMVVQQRPVERKKKGVEREHKPQNPDKTCYPKTRCTGSHCHDGDSNRPQPSLAKIISRFPRKIALAVALSAGAAAKA